MGDMLGVDNIKDFLEAEKDNPKQRRQFPPVLIIIDEVPNFLSIINQVPERLKKRSKFTNQVFSIICCEFIVTKLLFIFLGHFL